ncbi:hypothetical protein CYY_001590 [Polysphondylium violaceum]|uniref:tRNA methyltransferase 112 homolog n=1 Tax=Polysphondylium violaceum TaxID=133409 RepID=A0A8J4Q931_9MYCE|nr:hypothetical protein CYY_001590 [Polysphondylium violaceum]
MKVLTHNMMACTKKQCMGKGFPLGVECTESITLEQEFNYEFVKNIIPKLDWKGIQLIGEKLAITIPPFTEESLLDQEFLKSLYHLLCNVKIITGSLICPNCQRVYPIEKGIPNMLLREDEIYQDVRE